MIHVLPGSNLCKKILTSSTVFLHCLTGSAANSGRSSEPSGWESSHHWCLPPWNDFSRKNTVFSTNYVQIIHLQISHTFIYKTIAAVHLNRVWKSGPAKLPKKKHQTAHCNSMHWSFFSLCQAGDNPLSPCPISPKFQVEGLIVGPLLGHSKQSNFQPLRLSFALRIGHCKESKT